MVVGKKSLPTNYQKYKRKKTNLKEIIKKIKEKNQKDKEKLSKS